MNKRTRQQDVTFKTTSRKFHSEGGGVEYIFFYFAHRRHLKTETKKQLVARVLEKSGADVKEETSIDLPLTWDEAVAMIQIQERARQGRLRFQLMKQIRRCVEIQHDSGTQSLNHSLCQRRMKWLN